MLDHNITMIVKMILFSLIFSMYVATQADSPPLVMGTAASHFPKSCLVRNLGALE